MQVQADGAHTRTFEALDGNYEDIGTPGRQLRTALPMSSREPESKRMKLMSPTGRYMVDGGALAIIHRTPPQRSDVIDFFAERGAENMALRKQLQQSELDQQTLQDNVELLKTELHGLQATYKLEQECHKAVLQQSYRDKEGIERKLEHSLREISQLKHQLQEVKGAKDEAVERSRQAMSSAADVTSRLHELQNKMQARTFQADYEKKEAEDEQNARHRSLQRSIETLTAENERNQAVIRELQNQKDDAHRQLQSVSDTKRELESALLAAENKVIDFETQLTRLESAHTIVAEVESLRRQLHAQEAEVETARRLKKHVDNVAILKEKLRNAEEGARRAEQYATELEELKELAASKEEEVSQWKGALGPDISLDTPHDLHLKFAKLQAEVLEHVDRLAETQTALKYSQDDLSNCQQCVLNLEEQLEEERRKNDNLEMTKERLTKVAELLTQQRDELERKMQEARQKNVEGNPSQDEARAWRQRFEEQEQINGTLRERIKGLELIVDGAEPHAASSLGQSKAYRILHYKHNPEAAARQKLENERLLRLQAEVSALQKVVAQAKECQRTSNSQENIVAVVTNTEAEELRNEIADLKKQKERITTLFRSQIACVRKACSELLGYHLEMGSKPIPLRPGAIPPTTIKLTSRFGSAKDNILEFHCGSEGAFVLVQTPFSQSRAQDVEMYITRYNSIPAFTANITLELFRSNSFL